MVFQGHEEALALVSVHKSVNGNGDANAVAAAGKEDPDLDRAKELVDLHYGMKLKYRENGLDQDLLQARKDVEAIGKALG